MNKPKNKELYGLIGYPVKHSFSAFMHNAAFAHLGIDAEYRLFEVPPERIEDFFKNTIPEKKLKGFNVTVPHKEAVYDLMKNIRAALDEASSRMKSVNTVRVEPDGRLEGFNTDGAGFGKDLKEHGIEILKKNVSLIGAGGGAKAIAATIASYKPNKLLIFDIDKSKSLALAAIVKESYPDITAEAVYKIEDLKIAQADILINATPVGMKEADPLFVKKEWLHPGIFVYDLIYNPSETKLLRTAREAGCQTANGLGMLLYQGVLAFEHWTHKPAPIEVMRKALLERIHG